MRFLPKRPDRRPAADPAERLDREAAATPEDRQTAPVWNRPPVDLAARARARARRALLFARGFRHG